VKSAVIRTVSQTNCQIPVYSSIQS